MSILIPHYSSPMCDESLYLCLRMLRENSACQDHEILISTGFRDPYVFWNEFAEAATRDVLAFFNNDMLPAPGWDAPMMSRIDDNSLVTGFLVEPGVIEVARENIHRDFGRRPSSFQREEFEKFSAEHATQISQDESGWHMPVILTRSFFRRMGKYPIDQPFPHPNDVTFAARCRARGARFVRVRSFAYHFQALSNPAYEQHREG